MDLKIIQINIYKGKYLDNLLQFIHEEDPDVITIQELSSGIQNHYKDKEVDLFDLLVTNLTKYSAVRHIDFSIQGNRGSLGNAVFSKYKIVDKKIITLCATATITTEQANNQDFFPFSPRHVLDAIVQLSGHKVHLMSWHGAWTAPPHDTPQTLKQAGIVRQYLESLNSNNEPFILAGDLNNIAENKTIKLISSVADDLMEGLNLDSTLHPTLHKISPRGYAIDYIFCSKQFKLIEINVPEITVSDHLPIVAKLSLL